MRVSVIVPCRNEEIYIGPCLDSIFATTWPADKLEVLVLDGRSDDNTRGVAQQYQAQHANLRVLDNPRMIVSAALNIGIEQSSGEVVIRMDAHAIYPADYIAVLVAALLESGADNVGGCVRTLPADESATARAIALALAHPLGVGNSLFRIGVSEPRWVDTVPFGCFRRELFARIGNFDEELVRNQDDEFNHRLLRRGGRILLHPNAHAWYYGRRTLPQLSRMYYQYGFFKPLAARKAGGVATLRQLVPATFVISVFSLGLLAFVWPALAPVWVALIVAYSAALVLAALPVAREHGIRCAAAICAAFAVLHFSYGIGYLRGTWHARRATTSHSPGATPAVKLSR